MVNFINTAPLYETWKATVVRDEWLVVEGTPAELTEKLYAGELDLALVSSQEYAIHPESYRILSDLAIAADGAVGSVFIFSRYPLEAMDGRALLLTSRSKTSVSLGRIVLERHYRVHPRYRNGDCTAELAGNADAWDGVLVIGDEALRLAADDLFPFRYDLALVWHEWTGLPFVFAVWAVREDFWARQPATVREIHCELRRCQRQGLADLAAISQRVAPLIPMPPTACRHYLGGMRYDLSREQQAGLVRFIEMLMERNEAPAAALPLKMVDACEQP